MNEHHKLPRLRHSAQLKREVLAAGNERGASVPGVALAFGLSANLVRQWRRGLGFKPAGGAAEAATSVTREAQQQFIALAMPPAVPAPARHRRMWARVTEVRRGALQVSVSWTQAATTDCAIWLRVLLK